MNTGEAEGESQSEGAGAGLIAAMPTILWQRRWLIIVPLLIATIAGLTAAFMMHPVYESSATVLIEAQQVPGDLISLAQADMSDAISARVARARERVLSRQDLIRLIRTYDLYTSQQRTLPLSKIVDTMRKATTIEAVDDSLGFTGGKGRKNLGLNNTTAITVAFAYDDPVKAQVVAQQFVNHLLEVDAATQASQATDAVNFLTDQANTIGAQVTAIENRITTIKAQNGTVLALGQTTGDADSDVSRIDSQIAALQAESSKLASSAPAVPRDDTGVTAAETQLRMLQAKYSDTHPDVIAARAQLDSARRAAASSGPVFNPVAGQLAANRAQLASLTNARNMIASRSSSVQAAQARAPALTSQIDQLQKQADTLRDQARSIGLKLQAAQIQSRVETEQKGERLTLADPPVVPDSPIRPNRPVLILGSIFGGLAAGLGLALLLELLMRPIRGTAALKNVLGEAPLAVVPDFDQKPGWIVRLIERRTRRKFARG